MTRNQKKILIRTAWAVALVWQLITYYYAFPLMVERVTKRHMPGNEAVNVAVYNLLGVFAWAMLLVFWEERPFRGSKVLDYVGLGACAFLAGAIVWTSLSVWF